MTDSIRQQISTEYKISPSSIRFTDRWSYNPKIVQGFYWPGKDELKNKEVIPNLQLSAIEFNSDHHRFNFELSNGSSTGFVVAK